MPDRPLLVRRRTVVGGLAATVFVAACDSGEDIEPPGAGSSGSATPEPSEAAEQSPDQVLVDEVVAELGLALGTLAATRHHRALRAIIGPLIRAHRRHVEVLEGTLDDVTSAPVPDPTTALQGVRRSERRLHTTLVDAAGRAESGALARVLASMSASVTQHLAVLPAEVAP